MMPAAKHFDPILGVDVHIIQPPGPVPPVPIPHPYVGFVIDPFDYAPIIGSTVLINGVHRCLAGTEGKCVPPHIPIGGVFVKPPANEDEMFSFVYVVKHTILPAPQFPHDRSRLPWRYEVDQQFLIARQRGGMVGELLLDLVQNPLSMK